MVKTSIMSKTTELPQIKTNAKIFEHDNKSSKINSVSVKIELLLWNVLKKMSKVNLFRPFIKTCSSCKRKYAEIFVEYYIRKVISCKKCSLKTKVYSKTISLVMSLIEKGLKIPRHEFQRILGKNPQLKRLILNYLEGIGIYGPKIPLIPAGPIVTLWSITHNCNLNCKHCYISHDSPIKELTYKEVCKIIDQLYEANTFILGFSGGEPLLRKDIFEIFQYASEKMNVALATNGIYITPQIAEKLKDVGVGYVQISIDGLKETHDHNRGVGTYEKAISAIKSCLNAGLYVSMDVVVTKANVDQFPLLIDLAKRLKVQKIEIVDFVPTGKAKGSSHLMLSPIQMEKFGATVCDIWLDLMKKDYPLTLSFKNPVFTRIVAERFPNINFMPFFKGLFPKKALQFFNFSDRLQKGVFKEQTPFSPFVTGCECGIYVLHIKPDGNITPCPLNPAILGNVKKNKIKDIWQKSPILNQYRGLKFEGKCGKCMYKTICGGCRAKAFLDSGSHTESDTSCIINN